MDARNLFWSHMNRVGLGPFACNDAPPLPISNTSVKSEHILDGWYIKPLSYNVMRVTVSERLTSQIFKKYVHASSNDQPRWYIAEIP